MIHKFERRRIEQDNMYGVIVAESDDLLLIQHEYDFLFDGYRIIRQRDITKSYTNESNTYCTELMKKEGLWKLPSKAARAVPLDNWMSVFNALKGKFVIIENERQGDFYIGPILECDDRAVLIHHFDGCGEWQDIHRILYRSITLVQFGNRYIDVHAKHVPPRPL